MPHSGPRSSQARRYAHLISLETRLAEATAALEARAGLAPAGPTPKLPPGMKLLYTPAAALVEDPRLVRLAAIRWLFLRLWLARRAPTPAALRWFSRRLTGFLLYGVALRRHARGEPLPLRHPGQHVPAWALRAPPPKPQRRGQPTDLTTRAAGDGGSGDNGDQNQNNQQDDPLAWWAAEGAADALFSASDIEGLSDVIDPSLLMGNVEGLDLADMLDVYGSLGMSDLEIMKYLDAAWNGQGGAIAGQDVLDRAGIAGTFDIHDPYFSDYLRQQAGYLISNMDEAGRRAIANLLWGYTGGFAGLQQTSSVEALARRILDWNSELVSDLYDISPYRAWLIAVTEMARAESFGAFVAMWESGVLQKVWVVTSGACQICVANAEAGAIGITDSFPSGVLMPPAHPRCRCVGTPAVDSTFSPADWQPRDPGALDDLLFNAAGAVFPNIIFRAATTTAPSSVHLDALGRMLSRVAETAAEGWLRAVGARMPASEAELRRLALQTAVPDSWHAADEATWKRLQSSIQQAGKAWHAGGRDRQP